jgi:hypothetical protein
VDIIVTIPKTEVQNQKAEDAFVAQLHNQAVQFWKIHVKPVKLNKGDHVYFVDDGFITCYHTFIGYVSDPVCEVTGRVWWGLNLLLACPATYLKTPIPKKGFQGFHYTERLE